MAQSFTPVSSTVFVVNLKLDTCYNISSVHLVSYSPYLDTNMYSIRAVSESGFLLQTCCLLSYCSSPSRCDYRWYVASRDTMLPGYSRMKQCYERLQSRSDDRIEGKSVPRAITAHWDCMSQSVSSIAIQGESKVGIPIFRTDGCTNSRSIWSYGFNHDEQDYSGGVSMWKPTSAPTARPCC